MPERTYKLEPFSSPDSATKIETVLKKLNGINDVQVFLMSSKVKVSYDENDINCHLIQEEIEHLGFDVLSEE